MGVLGMLGSISERKNSESNKITREETEHVWDWIYSKIYPFMKDLNEVRWDVYLRLRRQISIVNSSSLLIL